jgi:predicted MFS family arabinose efflux permease
MRQDFVRSTKQRLFAFVFAALLLAQAGMAVVAWKLFDEELLPELDRSAMTVGTLTHERIAEALALGIPFDELQGVQPFFDSILAKTPGLGYLALSDAWGKVLYRSSSAPEGLDPFLRLGSLALKNDDARVTTAGRQRVARTASEEMAPADVDLGGASYVDVALDIRDPLVGAHVGALHVGLDEAFVSRQIKDIGFDIGIVMLTSLLFALEVLLFISTFGFLGPMRLVEQQLARLSEGRFGQVIAVNAPAAMREVIESLNSRVRKVNEAFGRLSSRLEDLPVDARGKAGEDLGPLLSRLRERFDLNGQASLRELKVTDLVDVRLLTFLFMFAEFLSRPFFPLYAKGLVSGPLFGISEAILIGLPITAFMLVHALSTPFTASLIGRLGCRRTYILGALLSTAGLIGTGLAFSLYDLILFRMLSGAGYATMFMACQAYVVANTGPDKRAQGIAMFVSGLMAAEICAPAIGGILADRIGFTWVFLLGAAVALISAGLAVRQMSLDDGVPAKTAAAGGEKGPGFLVAGLALMRNPRFAATVLFASIPAKLVLTGVLFYLAPVYLTELGASQSEIGRYLMTYGIASILLASVFARRIDRAGMHAQAVGLGGVLSGAVLLLAFVWPSPYMVLAAVATIGVAQAMTISAQLALVSKVGAPEARLYGDAAVLGVFRLVERIGSAAGPFVVGLFVSAWGTATAMVATGVLLLVMTVVYAVVFLFTRRQPAVPEAEGGADGSVPAVGKGG